MMALKKVGKLKDTVAAEGAEVAEGAAEGAGIEGAKARKPRAPGGRKSGRTWVIPRKRAEVIVQLAGNAGKEKLLELVAKIDKPGISVNNAANIKYANAQIVKKPEAYKHCGTQQFNRLAYAIAHKESALSQEEIIELGLVPENESNELMYDLVDAGLVPEEAAPTGEAAATEEAPAAE